MSEIYVLQIKYRMKCFDELVTKNDGFYYDKYPTDKELDIAREQIIEHAKKMFFPIDEETLVIEVKKLRHISNLT